MHSKIEIWRLLTQLVTKSEASLAKVLKTKHNIGLTEFHALSFLASADKDELRMQDLAGKLFLNQSSVTRLVERLERQGLTKRDVCPDDKRGVYTVLTGAGRKKVEDARPDYESDSLPMIESESVKNVLRKLLD